jgi:hypothetical protein
MIMNDELGGMLEEAVKAIFKMTIHGRTEENHENT